MLRSNSPLNPRRQAKPSQVYFTGDVKGQAAMKTEGDVGSAIVYQFRVGSEVTALDQHSAP